MTLTEIADLILEVAADAHAHSPSRHHLNVTAGWADRPFAECTDLACVAALSAARTMREHAEKVEALCEAADDALSNMREHKSCGCVEDAESLAAAISAVRGR